MSKANHRSNLSAGTSSGVLDAPDGYGWVSRSLHWGMALLFLVQLASSLARYFLEDTALEQRLWPSHSQIGLLLLFIVVFRGLWGLANAKHRPGHAPGLLGLASKVAHLTLYALMVFVPLLAVLRSFGSGRGIDLLGWALVERTGVTSVAWMDRAGDALHGELGWVFFALVGVHTVAAIFHERIVGSRVLHRMWPGKAR